MFLSFIFFNMCPLLLLQGFQNLVGVIFKYLQGQKKTLQEYKSCFKRQRLKD
jgi:hypothetical protein